MHFSHEKNAFHHNSVNIGQMKVRHGPTKKWHEKHPKTVKNAATARGLTFQ